MGRPIRFLDTPWGAVAFSTFGSGAPLVFDTGWISHLEALWDHKGYRAMIERLAETYRVICYDAPGTGLSSRKTTTSCIDDEADVLAAVLAAVVSGKTPQVSLFCSSVAASTAIRFASRHAGSVRSMVLFGACLDGSGLAPPDAQQALLSLIGTHWGLGSRTMRDIFVPGVESGDRDWFDRFQRESATGAIAAKRLATFYDSDVSADARHVTTPTLVVHRVDDAAVRFELGAEVAATIPDAALEPVDGSAHLCFLGDWHQVADLAIDFLDRWQMPGLPRGPFGQLTARENDVAELTLRGLSNAAMGEQLGISPRTVESHLGSIRNKLGVSTRAEIAAWMARRTGIG